MASLKAMLKELKRGNEAYYVELGMLTLYDLDLQRTVEDPEEDLEELPPELAVETLDFLEGDEDPLLEVDSPEEVMSVSEADSTEDSGPREMAINGGSSS